MGYCMDLRSAKFQIPADKKADALAAIKKLADDVETRGGGGSWGDNGKKESWYSWVTTSEFVEAKTLYDAMAAWRWYPEEDDTGNIVGISFDGEKLGDDTILLEAIAPFVQEGSYIEMQGEDGSYWRWVFEDEGMEEKSGRIVYE